MEIIYDIAETVDVPWGTIARSIDNNFTELSEVKADNDQYQQQFLNINSTIDNINSVIEQNANIASTDIADLREKMPTKLSQLTNDADYSQLQKYTYAQLLLIKDASGLIPGSRYVITDYDCIWLDQYTNEVLTESGEGWNIVLTAISTNEFSIDTEIYYSSDSAYATKGGISILKCKYIFSDYTKHSIVPNWADASSKGVIIYLKDSNNNELNYDFKHIKFRRWRVTDIKPNTTVDSKTNGTWGVYRTYLTESDLNSISDQRKWIGSGAESEKQLINDIFDGSFRNTQWGQTAYSQEFMNEFIKPYKNAQDNSKSYLAALPDSNEYTHPLQFSTKTDGTYFHMANFEYTVDSQLYYTFDYNGQDYSNTSYCHDNIIGLNNGAYLSNTVFQIYKENAAVFYNYIKLCRNNTIQLLPLSTYQNGFVYNTIDRFTTNIFSGYRVYDLVAHYVNGNMFLRSYLYSIQSQGYIVNSILFGAYSGLQIMHSQNNLFFGDPIYVKLGTNTTYNSPEDGNYWYDDMIDHWCGYNIMAPFQYAHFFPHTNTNTVLMPYNKGVIFNGTFQHNYVRRMRWGVEVDYGACQGIMFSGDIVRTKFRASAFAGQSHGQKIIETNPIPALVNVDVISLSANRNNFIPNLTSDNKILLSTDTPKMWIINGSTNKILKYSEL